MAAIALVKSIAGLPLAGRPMQLFTMECFGES